VFYPGGEVHETDITVVDPCSAGYLGQNKGNVKLTTKKAYEEKQRKYLEGAKARGHTFTPLVFETHGKMHDDVKTLLEMFASNTIGRSGLAVRDMALDLQITLARGNAICARNAIARSQRHQDLMRGARAPRC